jgi:hypothetical protein
MVSDRLQDWEQRFDGGIAAIDVGKRSKAGALLPIIPRHGEWEDFLRAVKLAWSDWQRELRQYPASLLLLYGGLAFFEYDDRTFWPHFADVVEGVPQPPSPNRQTEINSVFQWAAQRYLLTLMYRRNGTDFVGSAVYHVGIPLSLWEGFLEICEWAVWRPDWKELSDAEWLDTVERRAVGRPRLRRFLVDNRESASSFVQEILDARYVLTQDQRLSVNDIAQASVLRPEYFDEIPETADFLRPQNPESLFHDRATLVWDDRKRRLSVYLPGVASNQLPATWRIADRTQKASSSPDELLLNSAAFKRRLLLRLDSGQQSEVQLLRSPESWGLFDLEAGGRLVNSGREELPLRSYALLSLSPISFVSVEGFARDESSENEPLEFSDGAICYVTRLWPTGKYAQVVFKHIDASTTIRFRTKARLETRFYVGRGYRAAFFERTPEGIIKTDSLPQLCVVIPRAYFRDNHAELKNRFRVLEGDHVAGGEWKSAGAPGTEDRELFIWRWSSSPFIEARPTIRNLRSLGELGDAFKSRDMRGLRIFRVDAPDVPATCSVELVGRLQEVQSCWRNLPGAAIPWFLLCQASNGMTWDELLLAKDAIAPSLQLSPYLLRKCLNKGLLVQRGQRWFIDESRAALSLAVRNEFELKYCGDPSVLWGLYRQMHQNFYARDLPDIEVVDERGEIPYLRMRWPLRARPAIADYLKGRGVVMVKELWTH